MRYKPKTRLTIDELERSLTNPRSPAEMRSLYASAYLEVRALIQKEGEPAVWRRLKSEHASTVAELQTKTLARTLRLS